MNVASTETQYEIANIESITDIAMHALELRLVTGGAMAVIHDFIDNRLPVDSRNRRFAGRVNICHHYPVRIIEGAAKLSAQSFRAGIAMRLKHGQNPFTSRGARGL